MTITHPLASFEPVLPAYDVVIPCYNRAHVVAEAVESVLKQDHPPERLIVVDDGSTDASAAVIAALADLYPRVTAVLLPRNGGASHARNAGAALTRSAWLAFLDSDDLWLPGAARSLLRAGTSRDVDVVVGHFARVEPGEQPGEPECGWDGGDIRAALATGGVIGPSWSMVRREPCSPLAASTQVFTIATTGTSTCAPVQPEPVSPGSTMPLRCIAQSLALALSEMS